MFASDDCTIIRSPAGRRGAAVDGIASASTAGRLMTLLGAVPAAARPRRLRCLRRPGAPHRAHRHRQPSRVRFRKGDFVRRSRTAAVGMCSQSYAIWPHMTGFENVALPCCGCRAGKIFPPSRSGRRAVTHARHGAAWRFRAARGDACPAGSSSGARLTAGCARAGPTASRAAVQTSTQAARADAASN